MQWGICLHLSLDQHKVTYLAYDCGLQTPFSSFLPAEAGFAFKWERLAQVHCLLRFVYLKKPWFASNKRDSSLSCTQASQGKHKVPVVSCWFPFISLFSGGLYSSCFLKS